MKKKIAYLAAFLLITSCGDDNNTPRIDENGNITTSPQAEAETQSLQTVSKGLGGTCLALDFEKLNCANSLEELKDGKTKVASINMPVSLSKENGVQTYVLSDEPANLFAMDQLTSDMKTAEPDSYDKVLYSNVTKTNENFYSFMTEVSESRTIDASGEVVEGKLTMFGQAVPVTYAVSCSPEETSFHLVTGDYGLKTSYAQQADDETILKVKTTGINRFGEEQTVESYCTPAVASVEGALDEAGDKIEGAAEDVEEGAEEVAEDVEEGAEEVAEDAEEVVEDVKEDAEEVADDIEEGVEDAAENVEQGVTELANDTERAVDKAGQKIETEAKEAANVVETETRNARGEAREAADAIDNAVEQTGEAIEEGARAAGDVIEKGVDKAGEVVAEAGREIKEGAEKAAEATTETVANGLEKLDEAGEEVGAVVEGVSEAAAEKVADTAKAAANEITDEINEARADNQEDKGILEKVADWFRGLF